MNRGCAPAQLEDGLADYEDGRYDEAFAQLEPAARAGEARAQFCVGRMFERGDGTSRDEEAAATWYEKAAAQGDADAQCALGGLYEFGMGVERSIPRAAALYQQAAAQGHEEATRNLRELEKRGLVKTATLAKPAPVPPSAQTPTYRPQAPADPDAYTSFPEESAALAAYNAQPSATGLRKISDLRFQQATELLNEYQRTSDPAARDKAISYAETILMYDPNHVRTHLLLGSLAFLSTLEGAPAETLAEEHLERVAELEPANREARLLLAQLCLQQQWTDRGLGYYEQLLRADIRYANASHIPLMCAAYAEDDQQERGTAFFKKLSADNPGNAYAKMGLALMYLGDQLVSEASDVLEQLARGSAVPSDVKELAQAGLADLAKQEDRP